MKHIWISLLHTITSNIWSFLPFHLCSGNGGNFTGIWCPADLGPPTSLHAGVAALALVFAVIWAKQRRAAECLSTTLPDEVGEHGRVGPPIPDWIWWGEIYLSNPDLPLPGVNILLQPLALGPGLEVLTDAWDHIICHLVAQALVQIFCLETSLETQILKKDVFYWVAAARQCSPTDEQNHRSH